MISKKTVKIGANNVHTGLPEHGVEGALLWEENIRLTLPVKMFGVGQKVLSHLA